MINRRVRELTDEDISKVADIYHSWRMQDGKYEDVAGFCKSTPLAEIKEHDYVLTPGRYVGAEEIEEDGEAFEEKMERLTKDLNEQFTQSHELEQKIKETLGKIVL